LSSKNYLIRDDSFSLLINFIRENNVNKINLVGRPGSGKTTISKKLKKYLKTDLLNIDSLFDEVKEISEIKDVVVDKLTTTKKIIVDGTYSSLLTHERIDNTDLFVFVKSSILSSLLKVTKRAVRGQNEFKNERLSLRLMKHILLFKRKKTLIESKVEKNKIYYY
jgi:adenylate kinase family enzyme